MKGRGGSRRGSRTPALNHVDAWQRDHVCVPGCRDAHVCRARRPGGQAAAHGWRAGRGHRWRAANR